MRKQLFKLSLLPICWQSDASLTENSSVEGQKDNASLVEPDKEIYGTPSDYDSIRLHLKNTDSTYTSVFSPLLSELNYTLPASAGEYGENKVRSESKMLKDLSSKTYRDNDQQFVILNCCFIPRADRIKFVYFICNLYGVPNKLTKYYDHENKEECQELLKEYDDWLETNSGGALKSPIKLEHLLEKRRFYASLMYFRSSWKFKFDRNKTKKGKFYLDNEKSVKRKFMHSVGKYQYYEHNNPKTGFKFVGIPYGTNHQDSEH